MAIVVVRTQLPGGRLIAVAMQWPFFISSLILGFGWILMYGPAGSSASRSRDPGRRPVEPLLASPAWPSPRPWRWPPSPTCSAPTRCGSRDASLESAAQVCGAGPLRILFQVIVPMLRPPVVYSSILVFSMSVETLSVPLLYGQPVNIQVFSTFLYRNGLQSIDPDYSVLGAASAMILRRHDQPGGASRRSCSRTRQRFVSVRGKATRPREASTGLGEVGQLCAFIAFYVVFGALVPILGLVFRSFTLIFTPAAEPVRLPDDEELRDGLHLRRPTSSRSGTASSSPASARCSSARSPSWP